MTTDTNEPAATTLAVGVLFEDRYQIQGELGSGSFSRVYLAKQLSTGQSVAIKLLSERQASESSTGNEAERFRRETQICAALSHTNIVRLLDSGETKEGQLYAVFEHVPGETLGQVLASEGRLSVRESLRLLTQVLDALACAHAKGIVHRDLKPANLMLSGTGARRNALVLDFGLGGLVEDRRRKEWQTLTQHREFLGTPMYAAPEQLAGEIPTERSDLYAWGLVLFQCLTGRHPFEAEGAAARLMTGGGVVEIPDWLQGHRLGALLETVTARDAAKRDATVESLIDTLEEIARGELPVAPEESPTQAPLAGQGERRQLTVMFCDLFGSTALSQQLDAEIYREIVRAYQVRGAEAVERYEGHVVQYLGDGLLVYFGYPSAHEDDAERAIHAGRDVLRGLEMLSTRIEAEHGVAIAARVGIHTGPVVVGEMGGGEKMEVLALGDTPNIAARLESFAEPGTVVVSDATLRLVSGVFVTEDRGVPELKGIEEPIRVHRVLQPSGVLSRLERAAGLTPFVGREQELGLLLDRFEQAQEGQGQAVHVVGEAGIGKSRLIHRLRERIGQAPHHWLECRTSPFTQSSALHPLIEMVEEGFDFLEEDSSQEKLARLERGLVHLGLEPDEAVPLFASLLSIRLPERYVSLEISPQLQRQKTLEILLAWVLALGEKQSLVLLVEDLHWIDPSTLEWLGLLIEQCPTANLLLLMTHRPEFEPPWPGREHVLPIRLNRLRRREARELVAGTVAEGVLTSELAERIATRSDGVPLFAEELAKGAVEAGSSDTLDIPETLQDSLMARLDRLGDAKLVAQLGAALGREFQHTLLEAVAPLTETALHEGLDRLVESELVYRRGLPPKAVYTFRHGLVQDTAYQSLLESQRVDLHGRVADALEARFPERVARAPEEIAHHCKEAGRPLEAIGHYQQAGRRAMERSARAEAIDHLRQALALLQRMPETPERNQQELELQLALGAPLIGVKGYGDAEVERVHERARELCQAVGEGPELLRALIGLSLFHYQRGRHAIATELAEEALALAVKRDESYQLVVAHTRLGMTLSVMGELTRARRHLEQAVDLYDPAEHRPLASVWGQDWGMSARNYLSTVLWNCGYPERALRVSLETLELARGGDPFSHAFALTYAGFLAGLRDENERVVELADQAIAISREHGYPVLFALSACQRAYVRGGTQALEELQQSRAGVLDDSPFVDLCLARINLELGQPADALAPLEARLARPSENHHQDSELHRLRGEILLHQGAIDEAERCFLNALAVAREQEAKCGELRGATSLARLLRDKGLRDEARALLAPVYAWFTEGFDIQDLKDAKALLQELS